MQSKAKSSPPVAQQCRLTLQAKCARIEGKHHYCGTGATIAAQDGKLNAEAKVDKVRLGKTALMVSAG